VWISSIMENYFTNALNKSTIRNIFEVELRLLDSLRRFNTSLAFSIIPIQWRLFGYVMLRTTALTILSLTAQKIGIIGY
jgi:hypothetical protein